MLCLSSLQSRLSAVEQLIDRSSAASAVFTPPPLPTLPIESTNLKPTSLAQQHHQQQQHHPQSHPTILSKLSELTNLFHTLTLHDVALQTYLGSLTNLQTTLDSHQTTTNSINPTTTTTTSTATTRMTREEEVVLSASDMFQRTSEMIEQAHGLAGIIDQKWPIDGQKTQHQQRERAAQFNVQGVWRLYILLVLIYTHPLSLLSLSLISQILLV